jgi:hypothetical protein
MILAVIPYFVIDAMKTGKATLKYERLSAFESTQSVSGASIAWLL